MFPLSKASRIVYRLDHIWTRTCCMYIRRCHNLPEYKYDIGFASLSASRTESYCTPQHKSIEPSPLTHTRNTRNDWKAMESWECEGNLILRRLPPTRPLSQIMISKYWHMTPKYYHVTNTYRHGDCDHIAFSKLVRNLDSWASSPAFERIGWGFTLAW